MAARAQDGRVGKLRNHGRGIFGVPRKRAVAGLASYIGVLALAFRFGFIGMAGFARFVPGELDRSRADVVQGGGPKVAVLAELRRNDGLPDQEENYNA